MQSYSKPYAESCDINKQPILEVLEQYLLTPARVLEVGSCTGQHLVYFAEKLTHINWLPSDLAENIAGMKLWFAEAKLTNITAPIVLDVCDPNCSLDNVDAVYSANTVHIMSWPQVECFFELLQTVLKPGGLFILYGPFQYDQQHTSESNARFDQWLKARNSLSGVRDVGELKQLAKLNGLSLDKDIEMPINNRILIWSKHGDK